jgi:hypothetical protein
MVSLSNHQLLALQVPRILRPTYDSGSYAALTATSTLTSGVATATEPYSGQRRL